MEEKKNYNFIQNTKCEYFPCHFGMEDKDFNCMFCYCPLYILDDKCGGNFVILKNGIKDCSNCLVPHRKENYEMITGKIGEYMEEKAKKTTF